MRVELGERQEDLEGIWKSFNDKVRFRIARAGNRRFLRASDKAEAPHKRLVARGKVSTEKQLEIQCRAMAEGLLLGWEGLESDEGPLEYSTENAYLVLRFNPAIRDFVFDIATDEENFRREEIEATAKKSETFLPGEDAGA